MAPEPVASILLGNLLEMQILMSYTGNTELEPPRVGPAFWALTNLPGDADSLHSLRSLALKNGTIGRQLSRDVG